MGVACSISKEKGGKLRFCIDYRQSNAVRVQDAYRLPRIDETLDCLKGANRFSTLVLLSRYWQVGINHRASQMSTFVVRGGLFQWQVMPLRMRNASATFERAMEAILHGLQWQHCLTYIDDEENTNFSPKLWER